MYARTHTRRQREIGLLQTVKKCAVIKQQRTINLAQDYWRYWHYKIPLMWCSSCFSDTVCELHAVCLFTARRYASEVYAIMVCLSICPSVCLPQFWEVSDNILQMVQDRDIVAIGYYIGYPGYVTITGDPEWHWRWLLLFETFLTPIPREIQRVLFTIRLHESESARGL